MYDELISEFISYSIQNETEFKHYGVGQDANHPRGSGRFPPGFGVRPYQHDPKARAQYLKAKNASSGDYSNSKKNIHDTDDEQVWQAANKRAKTLRTAATGVALGAAMFNPGGSVINAGLAGANISRALYDSLAISKENERRKSLKVDKKTGFYLKKEETSIEDDVSSSRLMNDSYDVFNCNRALCAMSYDMRRRGYDVYAEKLAYPLKTSQYKNFYPDGSFSKVTDSIKADEKNRFVTSKESRADIAKGLEKHPAGSRGIMRVANSFTGVTDLTFERQKQSNGTTRTLVGDPYSGKTYDMSNSKDVNNVFRFTNQAIAMRTDNLTPNMSRMHEVCK